MRTQKKGRESSGDGSLRLPLPHVEFSKCFTWLPDRVVRWDDRQTGTIFQTPGHRLSPGVGKQREDQGGGWTGRRAGESPRPAARPQRGGGSPPQVYSLCRPKLPSAKTSGRLIEHSGGGPHEHSSRRPAKRGSGLSQSTAAAGPWDSAAAGLWSAAAGGPPAWRRQTHGAPQQPTH